MRYLFSSLFLVLCCVSLTQAQDATPEPSGEGWTLEQRCVGEPERAFNDFEGTLILQSGNQVRGRRAEEPSNYVISFGGNDLTGVGSVSPDGQWYAVPHGSSEPANSYTSNYHIEEIRIYSTDPTRQTYHMDWNYLQVYVMALRELAAIRWQDNNHFVYPRGYSLADDQIVFVQIDLVNQVEMDLQAQFLAYYAHYSPDWSSAVVMFYEPDYYLDIVDVFNGNTIAHIENAANFVSWKPDSSAFLAAVNDQLVLIDQNGIVDAIDTVYPQSSVAWSPDGQWAAFEVLIETETSYNKVLYLLDLTTHRVINTCLPTWGSMAWSQDSLELAYPAWLNGSSEIAVFDLVEWNSRLIADISFADVIGWRADD
jgi:hypothetical protein